MVEPEDAASDREGTRPIPAGPAADSLILIHRGIDERGCAHVIHGPARAGAGVLPDRAAGDRERSAVANPTAVLPESRVAVGVVPRDRAVVHDQGPRVLDPTARE